MRLSLAILFMSCALAQKPLKPTLSVGSTAADFTLPSQDGSMVSLHDFKGKWVVLYFYPKDGSKGCTIEAHNFQKDIAQYEKLGAVIVGVSIDTRENHKDFCTKEGLTFKVLADTRHEVSTRYRSITHIAGYYASARTTFLVNPEGKIAKVWNTVAPSTHSDEVLKALGKLAVK